MMSSKLVQSQRRKTGRKTKKGEGTPSPLKPFQSQVVLVRKPRYRQCFGNDIMAHPIGRAIGRPALM